ncbi:glycerol-3-phosphate responsive antiterminator [Ammoniphilus sp. CFH 90114]|uniref:glycerol-3-phosphate responsive antiterminator n=1 Tax=Ammoniphilus sp. CFH 90114 TaxID=2493665 RepID=UPI00100D9E8E|nr:glycerol-3-phosphate responsive antiterminator [Ammoniphilus sp. CFH 90114]RXT15435.1 glycerol-3-phosphate responsive antiterminator [Ammoniphilus sp. CFH 90114]
MKDNQAIKTIQYALKNKPVITSLVTEDDLDAILGTTSNIIFLLKGDIFTLGNYAERIRDAGKLIFVHFDLIEGIGKDQMGVRYLANEIGIDGIVTTKSNIILAAKKYGMMTIQRLFVFDSVSLENGIKTIKNSQPDAIEVLPGMVIPRISKRIQSELGVPVIAGGLILDLQDLELALDNGAIGISTSAKELWQWQDMKA